MSDDSAEIAASVAKVLGMVLMMGGGCWHRISDVHGEESLELDGSDLFSPYWQVRCRDWLLERGEINFGKSMNSGHFAMIEGHAPIYMHCRAAEFCARAIHELMVH